MNRIAAAFAAVAVLALAPAPASAAGDPAAEPVGDWIGTLHTPTIDIDAGLEIRRTPQGYHGVYDAISQGIWGVPLTQARPDAPLTLEVTNRSGTLTFAWDPKARDWTGAWRTKVDVHAMTLRRGAIPPRPLVSPPDMIGIAILSAVMVLEALGIARLLQLRRRRLRLKSAKGPEPPVRLGRTARLNL